MSRNALLLGTTYVGGEKNISCTCFMDSEGHIRESKSRGRPSVGLDRLDGSLLVAAIEERHAISEWNYDVASVRLASVETVHGQQVRLHWEDDGAGFSGLSNAFTFRQQSRAGQSGNQIEGSVQVLQWWNAVVHIPSSVELKHTPPRRPYSLRDRSKFIVRLGFDLELKMERGRPTYCAQMRVNDLPYQVKLTYLEHRDPRGAPKFVRRGSVVALIGETSIENPHTSYLKLASIIDCVGSGLPPSGRRSVFDLRPSTSGAQGASMLYGQAGETSLGRLGETLQSVDRIDTLAKGLNCLYLRSADRALRECVMQFSAGVGADQALAYLRGAWSALSDVPSAVIGAIFESHPFTAGLQIVLGRTGMELSASLGDRFWRGVEAHRYDELLGTHVSRVLRELNDGGSGNLGSHQPFGAEAEALGSTPTGKDWQEFLVRLGGCLPLDSGPFELTSDIVFDREVEGARRSDHEKAADSARQRAMRDRYFGTLKLPQWLELLGVQVPRPSGGSIPPILPHYGVSGTTRASASSRTLARQKIEDIDGMLELLGAVDALYWKAADRVSFEALTMLGGSGTAATARAHVRGAWSVLRDVPTAVLAEMDRSSVVKDALAHAADPDTLRAFEHHDGGVLVSGWRLYNHRYQDSFGDSLTSLLIEHCPSAILGFEGNSLQGARADGPFRERPLRKDEWAASFRGLGGTLPLESWEVRHRGGLEGGLVAAFASRRADDWGKDIDAREREHLSAVFNSSCWWVRYFYFNEWDRMLAGDAHAETVSSASIVRLWDDISRKKQTERFGELLRSSEAIVSRERWVRLWETVIERELLSFNVVIPRKEDFYILPEQGADAIDAYAPFSSLSSDVVAALDAIALTGVDHGVAWNARDWFFKRKGSDNIRELCAPATSSDRPDVRLPHKGTEEILERLGLAPWSLLLEELGR